MSLSAPPGPRTSRPFGSSPSPTTLANLAWDPNDERAPTADAALGTDVDLVHILSLVHELTIPGTGFAARAFAAGGLRVVWRRRDRIPSAGALCRSVGRKEVVIKAWSEAVNCRKIELVLDRPGWCSLCLTGEVNSVVAPSRTGSCGRDLLARVAESDGDWAIAVGLSCSAQ